MLSAEESSRVEGMSETGISGFVSSVPTRPYQKQLNAKCNIVIQLFSRTLFLSKFGFFVKKYPCAPETPALTLYLSH